MLILGLVILTCLGYAAYGRPEPRPRVRHRRLWEQSYERRPDRWLYDLPRPFGPLRLSVEGLRLYVDRGDYLCHDELDLGDLQALSLRCGDETIASAKVRSGVRLQPNALLLPANELHRMILVRQLRPLGLLFGLAELHLTTGGSGPDLIIPCAGPQGWQIAAEWYLRLQSAVGEAASPVTTVPQPYAYRTT